jgi:hypothetical protein
MQFPEHGLFGCLPPVNATLWKLPAVGTDALAPEHLVLLVEQDDADVRAKFAVSFLNGDLRASLKLDMHHTGPEPTSNGPLPNSPCKHSESTMSPR